MKVLFVYTYNKKTKSENIVTGYGNVLVKLEEYPCTAKTIVDIEEDLKKTFQYEEVLVLNMIPVKDELEEEQTKENETEQTIEELIETIEDEFYKNRWSSTVYITKEGKEITTDVDYVFEWFQEYREVLKERYGIKSNQPVITIRKQENNH